MERYVFYLWFCWIDDWFIFFWFIEIKKENRMIVINFIESE